MMYLGITVLATIMLYYELYVGGSVTTLLLPNLHMSFSFYVYTVAVGAAIGALGSLFAGLTDRIGRTNIVVIGLVLTALFVGILLPAATSKWTFTIEGFVVGFVEGICLVATPALIRDFSPQVGRATAMGFWTSGPVLGSLIVAEVGTITISNSPGLHFWTHEYHICGIAGAIVALIAIVGLKELSPQLRDQLMVTMNDRALIEAKAKGIDVEESLKQPFKQLVKPDVLISSLGVSIYLLIYYTAVGFGLIYFATVFGFTTKQGDGLGNWNWGFNVIAVVVTGILSDRLKVRKPFMILGGVVSAVMVVVYLELAGHHPGYYHVAIVVAILSFSLGVAYVPWMASYTETVEHHNPALTATGLAIWGLIIRTVVFVAYLLIPVVIHSMNPLVQYGSTVATDAKQYAPELAVVEAHPAIVPVLGELAKGVNATDLAQAHTILGPTYLATLEQFKAAGPGLAPALTFLGAHAAAVEKAAPEAPGQWKDWYWICFGGTIFFLLTVPLMRGRWSPSAAKADEDAHEAMIQAEMAKLGVTA
jgi:MFS family permease